MADESVQAFGNRLLRAVRENEPEKLVIDMRNNTGGNSTLLDPFIDALAECGHINQHGKIFVIIGRDTFSSALLNVYSLKNKTCAILVGEPTGGKPNCYGEVLRSKLEQSGLLISYSTKYYHLMRMISCLPYFLMCKRNTPFKITLGFQIPAWSISVEGKKAYLFPESDLIIVQSLLIRYTSFLLIKSLLHPL
jgi:hypothetical protein